MGTDVSSELPTVADPLTFSGGPLWLVLILLALVGGWWWWRWTQGAGMRGNPGDLSIQVLATRSLGPRSHLAIIEAAGSRSLIATTAQGVHFLRDLPVSAAATHRTPDFADHLGPPDEENS